MVSHVRAVIKAYWLLLPCLLLPFSAIAESSLDIELKKTTVELGRPVYLKIIGHDLQTDLAELPLTALESEFAVASADLNSESITVFNIKRHQDKAVQRQVLSLKLYPRKTGALSIPVFTIDKVNSEAQIIHVEEARSNGRDISLAWKLSSTRAWQREQILVHLTLTTADEFASLEYLEQPVAGFEATPLPVTRKWIDSKDGGHSVITAGWALLPLKPGSVAIELPPLQYRLGGVTRRMFYAPKTTVLIRPLPVYLPPTIPVGRIEISSSVSPAGWLYTDELAYWELTLSSQTLSPYWLPPILRQLESADQSIQFFPATSKRSSNPDDAGVNGKVEHLIPFKPLHNGLTKLPLLQVQYFDPLSGKIETAVHRPERSFAASSTVRISGLLLLLAITLKLMIWLYRSGQQKVHYRKQKNLAISQTKKANSARDLIFGLRQVAIAEGWSGNLCLGDWLQLWQQKYQADERLQDDLKILTALLYGNKEDTDKRGEAERQPELQKLAENLADTVALARKQKRKKRPRRAQDNRHWSPDSFSIISFRS
jgi:hypothetical protein